MLLDLGELLIFVSSSVSRQFAGGFQISKSGTPAFCFASELDLWQRQRQRQRFTLRFEILKLYYDTFIFRTLVHYGIGKLACGEVVLV